MNFFKFYKNLLYLLPEEVSHNLVLWLLERNLIRPVDKISDPILQVNISGIKLENPVGLAAGFDKNAAAFSGLARQNFGFLELGSVTPKAQKGNPKPRLFRLENSVINRMGFNNLGKEKFRANFLRNIPFCQIPIGINIGKNKDTEDQVSDYLELLTYFYDLGSYITINISSPNTPNLRKIQDSKNLDSFIKILLEKRDDLAVISGFKKPLFLKIAPDLTEEEIFDICMIAKKYQVDALIISNTSIFRPDFLSNKAKAEVGGLSGKALFDLSNLALTRAYSYLQGDVKLIGVGGIDSAESAYQKIKLGANLLQLYTGLIFKGLKLVSEINEGLAFFAKRDGFHNLQEAVGIESRIVAKK